MPLELVRRTKDYMEEYRDKKNNGALAQSFFHVLRDNEEKLQVDVRFQRKLAQQTKAFRERRIKDIPEFQDDPDAETEDQFFENIDNEIKEEQELTGSSLNTSSMNSRSDLEKDTVKSAISNKFNIANLRL